jgi:uncharacterized protein
VNYYALYYEVVEDFLSKRAAFREEHLRQVSEGYNCGDLVLAGALGDPADAALLIFCVADKNKVEAFAKRDPYVVHGLVKNWQVRPWSVVNGCEMNGSLNGSSAQPLTSEVVRRWTALATEENWPKYREHFSNEVLPALRAKRGFLGARLYVRRLGDTVEILVMTSWDSLESIRQFAGSDLEAAVVAEEASSVLSEYDRRAHHYELVISQQVRNARPGSMG